MWTWKADTPANVPAGARISAGKSGKVARSLPYNALDVVNRSPVSCIPSPESPANRMTTRSRSSTDLDRWTESDKAPPLAHSTPAPLVARCVEDLSVTVRAPDGRL